MPDSLCYQPQEMCLGTNRPLCFYAYEHQKGINQRKKMLIMKICERFGTPSGPINSCLSISSVHGDNNDAKSDVTALGFEGVIMAEEEIQR